MERGDRLLLDTNALVVLREKNHPAAQRIEEWAAQGGVLGVCVEVWHEFLCGPLTREEQMVAETLVGSEVLSLHRADAELAAELFNATGRRRSSHADCLIAASAINAQAAFLTLNIEDFRRFEEHGLLLIRP